MQMFYQYGIKHKSAHWRSIRHYDVNVVANFKYKLHNEVNNKITYGMNGFQCYLNIISILLKGALGGNPRIV